VTDLPLGWASTTLKDGATLKTGPFGSTLHKSDYVEGGIPIINPMHIKEGRLFPSESATVSISTAKRLSEYRLETGDVVLGRRGEMGRCAVVQDNQVGWLCGTGSLILRPSPSIDARFLQRFLSSPQTVNELVGASVGSTMVNLNQGILSALDLPLPPLAEQIRIADKLDTVVAKVEACGERLDRVPQILKKFREAVLEAAVSGRLTEAWRSNSGIKSNAIDEIREIGHGKLNWVKSSGSHNEAGRVKSRASQFSAESLTSRGLPDSWVWAPIEDACLLVVDCHNKTAPYSPTGVPLVRTSNIRDGQIVWNEMRYVDAPTYQYWSRRCPPEPGDIVFTREAPIAESALIPDRLTLCLGQRTMLFRTLPGLTDPRFLLLTLQDTGFKRRAMEAAVGTGVKHLRVGDVGELRIPLAPLNEQREIVRRCDELFALADNLQRRYSGVVAQAAKLTPSILAKAFRGELVSQDPNDEGAGEMMERIKRHKVSA
jgi:type I restriction enzyme S subunit